MSRPAFGIVVDDDPGKDLLLLLHRRTHEGLVGLRDALRRGDPVHTIEICATCGPEERAEYLAFDRWLDEHGVRHHHRHAADGFLEDAPSAAWTLNEVKAAFAFHNEREADEAWLEEQGHAW